MRRLCSSLLLLGLLLLTNRSYANRAVTVDGTGDVAENYSVLALQNTQTGFGNNSDDSVEQANGSELNGIYLVDDGENFFLLITGNIETNFNKLDIFLDYEAGGQNVLRNDNPVVDFNGLNAMAGLTFDAGFEADYFLSVTNGNNPVETYANYANLETAGGGTGGFVGGGTGSTVDGTSPDIDVAINNSNTGGVESGTGTSTGDAAAVTTGVEIKIAKSALGIVNGARATDLKITAFINSSDHTFLSNQVLAGIGGGSNLANPAAVNFADIPGNQFVQTQVTSVTLTDYATSTNGVRLIWIGVATLLLSLLMVRHYRTINGRNAQI